MSIIVAIEKIIERKMRNSIVVGVVQSFNEEDWTCEVEYKGLVLPARMRAVVNAESSGLRIEPVVGSHVVLALIDSNINALVVVQWSQLVRVKIDAELVELNGEGFSIVKAEELQSVMDQNAQFISAFKNILSGPPIPEPGSGAPSAFQTALNAALSSLQWGNHDNIQNETIKHG